MSRINLGHARTFALAASGVTFATIGVLALLMPVRVAHAYGLALEGVEGLNQMRAVYTGFWISLGVTMTTAARRPDLPLLGDVCGLMILLQALGRLASFGIDGVPNAVFVAAFFAELAAALTILGLRGRARAAAAATGRAIARNA